jgi:hypothetical protein
MVVAQVADDGTISTYIASQSYDTGTNTCAFTAQILTTKS